MSWSWDNQTQGEISEKVLGKFRESSGKAQGNHFKRASNISLRYITPSLRLTVLVLSKVHIIQSLHSAGAVNRMTR